MKSIIIASLVLSLALPGSAYAQAPNAAPATAQAAPQAAQQQLTGMPSICRIREREVMNVNAEILNRNAAAQREKDELKRSEITAPIQNLQAVLREVESSWNRMDCARMLYGAR